METNYLKIAFQTVKKTDLNATDRALYQAALVASTRAYAPYSHFCVGAAVRLANGEIVTGCNQENAAYPSGLCAERVTLFAAGAAYPDVPFESLAIIAQSEGVVKDSIAPCGACCQVMLEAEMRSHRPLRVLLCGKESVRILNSVSSLLPFSFDAKDLE